MRHVQISPVLRRGAVVRRLNGRERRDNFVGKITTRISDVEHEHLCRSGEDMDDEYMGVMGIDKGKVHVQWKGVEAQGSDSTGVYRFVADGTSVQDERSVRPRLDLDIVDVGVIVCANQLGVFGVVLQGKGLHRCW